LSWKISKFRVRALYDFGTSFKSYAYKGLSPKGLSPNQGNALHKPAQKVVEKKKEEERKSYEL